MRVTGDDWARLGPEAERVAHFIGNRAFMKMAGGHCAALGVRAATDGSGAAEFFCTVYALRPQVCRDLGRGSPECEAELMRKAGEVGAAQARVLYKTDLINAKPRRRKGR